MNLETLYRNQRGIDYCLHKANLEEVKPIEFIAFVIHSIWNRGASSQLDKNKKHIKVLA